MSDNFRFTVIRSATVNMMATIGLRVLTLAQAIVFARCFTPSDLGQLSTVILVISLLMLFTRMGFDESVIRERNSPRTLMDSAFTLSLLISLALLPVTFGLARAASALFGRSELVGYVMFMSFLLFATSLGLPNALWVKEFRFGIVKVPTAVDFLASTCVAVGLRLWAGIGVWSLFIGKLTGFIANYITVWLIAPYRPKLRLKREDARSLYHFGWPVVGSTFCNFVNRQAGDALLVRYFWGAEALAYYSVAAALPLYLSEFVDMLVSSLLPAYAYLTSSRDKVISAFLEANKLLAAIVIPVGSALVIFADPIVRLLFGEKWSPAIPLLKGLALGLTIHLIGGYSWGILCMAWGKTRYLLLVNLATTVYLFTVGLFLVKTWGPVGATYYVISQAVLTVGVVRFWILYRELGTFAFITDMLKPTLAAGVAASIIYPLLSFTTNLPALAITGASYLLVCGIILWFLDRSLRVQARQILAVFGGPR